MAKQAGAGPLREVLAAEVRTEVEDIYGNTVTGPWTEQSRHPASLDARRGGEAVIAGRLQGIVNYVVTARYSQSSAAIRPEWRFRDTRSGLTYAILTAIPRPKRDYIDFDVTLGVAE